MRIDKISIELLSNNINNDLESVAT